MVGRRASFNFLDFTYLGHKQKLASGISHDKVCLFDAFVMTLNERCRIWGAAAVWSSQHENFWNEQTENKLPICMCYQWFGGDVRVALSLKPDT